MKHEASPMRYYHYNTIHYNLYIIYNILECNIWYIIIRYIIYLYIYISKKIKYSI